MISKFAGYRNPIPVTSISLYEFFTDYSHKDIVKYIRTLDDKEEIKLMKAKLPAITVSGLFQTRNALGLINHSGYICVDIDGADNKHISDFNMIRDELKKCLNIAYASLSVTGRGVFCLIPLKEPEKHKEHFEALKIIFKTFGITIDKACGDVTRLRGYSYDPDAYFNENAVTFTQTVEHQAETSHTRPPKTIINTSHNKIGNSTNKAGNNTHSRVMKIITEINSKGIDITESYHDWFQVACALGHEFGESGRDMFLLVSQNNPSYNPDAADNLFSECLQRNYSITIGTFFHLAGAHGIK